ncbi:small ribosomal subunit protein uS7m-like [Carassius carassius]|uniref:small ribosomal subunit protein uS7m-like n=1 Tax=Carassius carassius TaxID=217509 RepID=UPI002868D7D4|nr:small ribosomal subunit protein uS7m-like [Carassius carassius]
MAISFINMMMQDGNKILARGIMTQTLETIKRKQVEKYHKSPAAKREEMSVIHTALENCKPIISPTRKKEILIRNKRYGQALGTTSNLYHYIESYSESLFLQVPVSLTDNRRCFLATKWMITECRDNKHRCTHMYEKLSQELLAAFANEGNIVKRKHDLHKMAEANRAHAHYCWW